MASNVTLRSYLDLSNGELENTVNYSNGAIVQEHSSLRRFTKRVGSVAENLLVRKGDDTDGYLFELTLSKAAHDVEVGLRNRLIINANGGEVAESADNALVYYRNEDWSKYILEYGPDLKNPRYIAFYNLDNRPIYICKAMQIIPDDESVPTSYTYKLVPFLTVLPNTSVGPMIFNPRYGNLFVVSEPPSLESAEETDQDLYVIAYNG